MARVLLAGRIHAAGRALLDARSDVEYEMLESPTVADIDARIGDVDGMVIRTTLVSAETIARSNRLRVVSRHGVGYDNIDVDALTARGIPLTVVGSVNAVTVAEHTLGLMLAVTHQILTYDRAMRAGNYGIRDSLTMTELAEKTVLVVGYGRVGTRVSRLCNAFGMQVIAADPYVDRAAVEGAGFRYLEDFRDALGEADFVTLHMPGKPDRSPVMGAPEFARMKRGAFFINCARGTLVDEPALVAALRDGPLRGAGIDVTREEPPADDHPLLTLDNVVLSPHSAGLTEECVARMGRVAVQNVLDTLDGRLNPDMVVNKAVLS